MEFTKEFIDKRMTDVLGSPNPSQERADKMLRSQAQQTVKILANNKLAYKSYGPFWWAVKDMLREYAPESVKDKWYMKLYDEPLIKERNWYGSLIRTICAAVHYHQEQYMHTSDHHYEDAKGIVHDYTLFDWDAEC